MIVCPNCTHPNPDGAVQCEACYTPLPTVTTCPSCGASVQSDASFCGQCGFDLRPSLSAPGVVTAPMEEEEETTGISIKPDGAPLPVGEIDIPDLPPPEPLIAVEPIAIESPLAEAASPEAPLPMMPVATVEPVGEPPPPHLPAPELTVPAPQPVEVGASISGVTQLQITQAKLLHLQTNGIIELPTQMALIRIGKPNDRFPPDIDVSGFPNSEIVSRNHAALRVEGDVYYIEDVGSSNGTYINNMPLPYGNRHRLRPGDRIALGKGDKVTFIFQLA